MVNANVILENAHIWARNFAGEERKFNPAGTRNFCVTIDIDKAKELEAAGWPIKWMEPTDEYSDPMAFMRVTVYYGKIEPKIQLISSGGKSVLNAETVGILDSAEIANVDMVLRPYNWEVGGRVGVKPYLKSMYVTLAEDELAYKYADEE